MAQGAGHALFEQALYDPGSGQPLAASFMDYCLPKADDVPALPVALTEHRSVINPLGVKGVGESGDQVKHHMKNRNRSGYTTP